MADLSYNQADQVVSITDETNIVGVTPASTAPLAAQPALVVAVSPNTPTLPVKLAQHTLINADLETFGAGVVASRVSQFSVNFSTPLSLANVTTTIAATSPLATVTQNASQVILTSGTAATASAIVRSNSVINYKPGREVYGMATAAFTSGVAGSSQRWGLYDSSEGFWIGYSGTSFGIAVRTGGVDTFTPQASFNGDVLTGQAGSGFTRSGVPEAINTTFGNLYRIRFGWLGYAPIQFEVASPDGGWVVMHTLKHPNVAVAPSVAYPSLPITLEVSKTSGATSLVMYNTCMEAGIVAHAGAHLYTPGTISTSTPGALGNVITTVSQGYSCAAVDVTGTWTGTLAFEGQNGDGVWYSLNAVSPTNFTVLGLTSNSTVIVDIAAASSFRVRATSATSWTGVANVTISLDDTNPFFTSAGVRQQIVVSPGNSTPTLSSSGILAAGSTLTGPSTSTTAESTLGAAYIQFSFKSDTTCQIFYDFSQDGTNWDIQEDSEIIPALYGEFRSIQSKATYFRVRVTNIGAAPSTFLRLTSYLTPVSNQDITTVGGLQQTSFFPDPSSQSTQEISGLSIDSTGNLVTSAVTGTDWGSFNDTFPGASLQTTVTASVAFKNGINIVSSSTGALVGLGEGQYVRLGSDTDANLTQISSVQNNGYALELQSTYPGTTNASGTSYVYSNWAQTIVSTGSITVAGSSVSLASGTTSGGTALIFRNVDTLPLHFQSRFAITRAAGAGQTINIGFQDAITSPVAAAYFSFSGAVSTTTVACVTQDATGAPVSTTFTLPGGVLNTSQNLYEILIAADKIAFFVNRTLLQVSTITPAAPYKSFGVFASATTTVATSASILISSVVCLNHAPFDATCHQADASKLQVLPNGLANTTAPAILDGVVSPLSLDTLSNLRVTNAPNDGVKASYMASAVAFANATGGSDLFTITGSATKTVRVLRIGFSGTRNTSGPTSFNFIKRSTADSGGTSAASTAVPLDSNDAAATATVLSYTTAPTNGTAVGTVKAMTFLVPQSTTTGNSQEWVADFTGLPAKALVLRGTSQVLALNLNAGTTGGTWSAWVVWTEE